MKNTATICESHSCQARKWGKSLSNFCFAGLVEPWNRCRSTRGHCRAWPTTVGSACCRKWQSLRSWCCLQIQTQLRPVMTSLMWVTLSTEFFFAYFWKMHACWLQNIEENCRECNGATLWLRVSTVLSAIKYWRLGFACAVFEYPCVSQVMPL